MQPNMFGRHGFSRRAKDQASLVIRATPATCSLVTPAESQVAPLPRGAGHTVPPKAPQPAVKELLCHRCHLSAPTKIINPRMRCGAPFGQPIPCLTPPAACNHSWCLAETTEWHSTRASSPAAHLAPPSPSPGTCLRF